MKLLRVLGLSVILTVFCAVAAGAAYEGIGEVTGDLVRLRAGSGTDSSILTTLPQGERVLITGTLDGWYGVKYKSWNGYMSADYIELLDLEEGDLGYGVVSTEGSTLNLRSGPGTDFDKLAAIPYGAALKLIGLEDDWFKVTYKDLEGYVHSDYVAPTAQERLNLKGQKIVEEAKRHLGKPYVWGAKGPNSFDCSGLVQYVAKHALGVEMQGGSSTQWKTASGTRIKSLSNLRAGDIVYICNPKYAHGYITSHVGIYLGNDQILHADSNRGVTIDNIYDSFAKYFVGAIRLG